MKYCIDLKFIDLNLSVRLIQKIILVLVSDFVVGVF